MTPEELKRFHIAMAEMLQQAAEPTPAEKAQMDAAARAMTAEEIGRRYGEGAQNLWPLSTVTVEAWNICAKCGASHRDGFGHRCRFWPRVRRLLRIA